MNVLNLLDRLADKNWWFVLTTLFVFFAWIVVRHFLRRGVASNPFPRIMTTVDLMITPLALISLASLLRTSVQQAEIVGLDEPIRFQAHLGVFVSSAWFIARLLELFILSRSRNEITSYLPGLERGLLFGGMLFLGIVAFLSAKGYSITGIYVSTGAVAALIAFAMQRTLGDLFSGIALSMEHPFRLGDWIELENGRQGRVIDINWRATRLRAWDNTTLIIPNGELAQQGLKNLHGSDHRFSPWYEVKLPAEVDPRFATALLLEAALACKRVLKDPLPSVRLADASTVPYTYRVWVHFANYPAMFSGREELFREIHGALKKAGVQPSPRIQQMNTHPVEAPMAEPPTPLLALKGLDIGGMLNDEELAALAAMSESRIFDAGVVILEQGVVASFVDIIVSGLVESAVSRGEGQMKPLDQLKPGDYFGIASMLTNVPSILRFTALTDVTLMRIDMDCLRSIIAKRPSLSNAFATIVEQRVNKADRARCETKTPGARLNFQDILRRIHDALH